MFSLQENSLVNIFEDFTEFLSVLKVRAVRRHRYLRKLKHQQQALLDIKQKCQENDAGKVMDQIHQDIFNLRKARLTEDKMRYEDLAVMDLFSDDEITVALNRQIIRERKDKSALMKARKLQEQLLELKKFAIDGM